MVKYKLFTALIVYGILSLVSYVTFIYFPVTFKKVSNFNIWSSNHVAGGEGGVDDRQSLKLRYNEAFKKRVKPLLSLLMDRLYSIKHRCIKTGIITSQCHFINQTYTCRPVALEKLYRNTWA